MGSHEIWDLGLGGPKMELWVTGMNGALWDLGFGVEWTKHGYMGPGWDNMGLRDGWGPMGCGIWGRVAQRWTYGVRDEWDPIRSGIWGQVDQRWSYGTGMRMGMDGVS